MRTVRLIATILFYTTRIASLLFLLTGLFAFAVLSLSLYSDVRGLPIVIKPDSSFNIFFPFTTSPFLAGDYSTDYMLTSTGTILLYSLFLWLLSAVFRTFKQQRLFTAKGVSRLERFYVFNLGVPVLCLLFLAILNYQLRDALIIVFLHLMIGVFAFFMATIFKQGLLLQEEQDLTL